MVLVDFPEVVKAYSPQFEDCFTEEGYNHFQRFLSGLLVGSNFTVQGINRLFALDPRNQSSANRFVNRQNFDLEDLNQRRIDMMQSEEATSIKENGVLSIDGSLLHHVGTQFDGISNMWDHVDKTYGPRHELVTLYYTDDTVNYPLHYQLWEPPDWEAVAEHLRRLGKAINEDKWNARDTERKKWCTYISDRYRRIEKTHHELQQTYRTKIHMAEGLLRKYLSRPDALRLPIALDSGFSSNYLCNIISDEFKMDYVADVSSRLVIYQKGNKEIDLKSFIVKLKAEHKANETARTTGVGDKVKAVFKKVGYHYRGKKQTVYAYCGIHRLKSHGKKQKLIIQFYNEELKGDPRISITNRLNWYPHQILSIRRNRWPIETYHQEAKAQGLESYQVRNMNAIQTHIALVVVAYTMLTKSTLDEALMEKLRMRLKAEADTTLPFMRRLLKGGAFFSVVEHVYLAAKKGQSIEDTFAPLMEALAYN